LIGQILDLRGDGHETFASFTGTCGLDRRVQSQQIGLGGDLADQLQDLADARGGLFLLGNLGTSMSCIVCRFLGHAGGFSHLLTDVADRTGHLFGDRCYRLHIAIGLTGGPDDLRCLALGHLGQFTNAFGRVGQNGSGVDHDLELRGHRAGEFLENLVSGLLSARVFLVALVLGFSLVLKFSETSA
jgi:hypothetical protein